MVSHADFNALSITLRYLIHFESNFAQDERQGSNFSLLQEDIHFFQNHFHEETVFSPMFAFGKKSGTYS
jgi:hypothetical protein